MIIHPHNGRIELSPELTLYPELTPQILDARTTLSSWENIRNIEVNSDYHFHSYRRKFVDYLTRDVVVDVTFNQEQLWVVECSFFLDCETVCRQSTIDAQCTCRMREAYHQDVLHCLLEVPTHCYCWGYVAPGSSEYDDFPTIVIAYGATFPQN